MKDLAQKAKDAVEDLTEALNTRTIDNLEVEDLVNLGALLKALYLKVEGGMGGIKTRLRREALQAAKGQPGDQVFRGSNGAQCVVKIPRPRAKLRASTNALCTAKEHPQFFAVSYRPIKGFMAKAGGAAEETQTKLVSAIDVVTDLPRVTFKR